MKLKKVLFGLLLALPIFSWAGSASAQWGVIAGLTPSSCPGTASHSSYLYYYTWVSGGNNYKIIDSKYNLMLDDGQTATITTSGDAASSGVHYYVMSYAESPAVLSLYQYSSTYPSFTLSGSSSHSFTISCTKSLSSYKYSVTRSGRTTSFTSSTKGVLICMESSSSYNGQLPYTITCATSGGSSGTSYTVSYKPGSYANETTTYSATKTSGVALTLRGKTYTRDGYTQTGWSTTSEGTSKAYELSASYTTDASKTLYPYWTASATLSSLVIGGKGDGYSGMTRTYVCTAMMSDGSSLDVTPTWSITSGSAYATVSSSGVVTFATVSSDQTVVLKASYTYGGVTKTQTSTLAVHPVFALTSTLGNSGLTFTTGGSAQWFGQSVESSDGTLAARSGIITHSQTSYLETTVTGPGTFSFNWYASSEGGNYDYLFFSIDGVQTNKIGGTSCSWTQCTYAIGEGTHTFRWTYRKDGSVDKGMDAGYVDTVVWTTEPDIQLTPPENISATTNRYDNILVEWDSVADAEGYYLLRVEDFMDESTMVLFDVSSNFYVDDSAVPGKKYYYAVASYYGDDISDTVCLAEGCRRVKLVLEVNAKGISASGGEQSVEVMANTGWTAVSSENWIILNSAAAAGNGSLTYEVAANEAEVARLGYVTVTAGAGTDFPLSLRLTVEQAAATPTKPLTLANALGVGGHEVSTTGDAIWFAQEDASAEGKMSARSGIIGLEERSCMSLVVSGPGTFTFKWKGDCEADPRGRYSYDFGAFDVDGDVKCRIDGATEWQSATVEIQGQGSHVLTWTYTKDDYDEEDYEGGDCIWVDAVTWSGSWPDAGTAFPDLGASPTAAQVAEAVVGVADAGVRTHITDGTSYNAFRTWALAVKDSSGKVAGLDAVANSSWAWLSYALASEKLIEALKDGDVKVEAFVPKMATGKFDFTVSVDGVQVGNAASQENLKKVFGIEGSTSLGAMSSDNVELTFGTPVNGKVKFTAGPKDTSLPTFFMRVKLVQ